MVSSDRSRFRRVLTAGAWVSVGLVLGRVTGLFRDLSLVQAFGIGPQADAATLSMALPDVLVGVITGGAISAVLVPEFQRRPDGERFKAFNQANLLCVLLFCVVAAVLSRYSDALAGFMAPGFAGNWPLQETSSLFSWVVWSLPLIALSGISTAFLHSHGRFAVAAMENVFSNLIIIGVFYFFVDRMGLGSVPMAVLLAAGFRFLTQQLASLGLAGSTFRLGTWAFDRSLMIRFFQSMLAGTLAISLPVVARQLASYGEAGSVATLTYALRLADVPLAICLSVLAKVIFPQLSELFLSDETAEKGTRLAMGALKTALALSLCLSLSLIWLAYHASALPLEWKGIDQREMSALLHLTGVALLALPAMGLTTITTMIFSAKRHTAAPFYVMGAGMLVFIGLGVSLRRDYGVYGVIGAFVATQYLVLILHLVVLRSRLLMDCFQVVSSRATWMMIGGCGVGFLPAVLLRPYFPEDPRALVVLAFFGGSLSLGCALLMDSDFRGLATARLSRLRSGV